MEEKVEVNDVRRGCGRSVERGRRGVEGEWRREEKKGSGGE